MVTMSDPITERLLKLSREELVKELRKLHPQERLIKIKKLEEARKKDLEETSKIKQQSIEEVSLDEIVVEEPEQATLDLESLFEGLPMPEESKSPDIEHATYESNVETIATLYNQLQEATGSGYGTNNMDTAAVVYEGILRGELVQPDSETIKDIANASRRMMKSFLASYQKHNDYII